MIHQEMRILVIAATEMEKEAVIRGLEHRSANHPDAQIRLEWEVICCGVGSVQTAVQVMKAGSENAYDLIIGTGIAGGFRITNGSLVIANEVVCADLGADDLGTFRSVKELGFGEHQINCHTNYATRVYEWIQQQANRPKCYFGSFASVNTVTGTLTRANQLLQQIPGVFAEDMESFGLVSAAKELGVPVMILRAVSNPVGPRDRASWRIDLALESIQWAFTNIPSSVWSASNEGARQS